MKVDLKDISLFDLDSQTVLLITKFVRCVRDQENVALKLTDPMIVRKVFDIGMTTSKPTLKAMFLKVREALSKQGHLQGQARIIVSSGSSIHDDIAAA